MGVFTVSWSLHVCLLAYFQCRSLKNVMPTTTSFCSVMLAASSEHFTATTQILKKSTSWLERGQRASPRKWLTNFTNTVQTENSSMWFQPKPCLLAWMLLPSITTCGKPSDLQCQRRLRLVNDTELLGRRLLNGIASNEDMFTVFLWFGMKCAEP